MSSSFESMVNEMVRWSTTPELKKKPEDEAAEAILEEDELDLEDELDSDDDEVSPWPSSGRSNSTLQKKADSGAV